MRLWGMIYTDGQKVAESITELSISKKADLRRHESEIISALATLAHDLDLERPVIVKKHMSDLYTFGRAVFRPQDFVEDVSFDRFTVEVIPDTDD